MKTYGQSPDRSPIHISHEEHTAHHPSPPYPPIIEDLLIVLLIAIQREPSLGDRRMIPLSLLIHSFIHESPFPLLTYTLIVFTESFLYL